MDAIYTYQLGSNYTRQTEKEDAEGEGEKTEKSSRQIAEGAGKIRSVEGEDGEDTGC